MKSTGRDVVPILLLALAALAPQASAEIFELSRGGRIEGVLLNPHEVPRQAYSIGLPGGMRVTLPMASVRSVTPVRDVVEEYQRRRIDTPDTLDAQIELALWCRDNYLAEMAQRHWQRVLDFDPDQEQARAALGYIEHEGRWTTREDEMRAAGYVFSGGLWRTPQEVRLLEEQRAFNKAEGQWRTDLRIWRTWLDGGRAKEAHRRFVTIDDPVAIGPLAEMLHSEDNEKVRELYLSALHRIGTPAALREITQWSMDEPLDDLRDTCFDYIRDDPYAVDFFISRLSSNDNTTINRAAYALKHFENRRAIPALIHSLITVHKQKITLGDPNRMDATFGSGGTSFGAGKKDIVREDHVRNEDVLDALVELSGGANFGFDVDHWRAWWADQRQLRYFDPRRG